MKIRRIIILSLALLVTLYLSVIKQSYFATFLSGVLVTLLMFSTIGQVLYNQATKRIDLINQRIRDGENNIYPN